MRLDVGTFVDRADVHAKLAADSYAYARQELERAGDQLAEAFALLFDGDTEGADIEREGAAVSLSWANSFATAARVNRQIAAELRASPLGDYR